MVQIFNDKTVHLNICTMALIAGFIALIFLVILLASKYFKKSGPDTKHDRPIV